MNLVFHVSPEGLLVVDSDGVPLPSHLNRGDDCKFTVQHRGKSDLRVYIKVLDEEERWPTTTLERLQRWLMAHDLDRLHGMEILRIMNGWEPSEEE